VDDLVPMVLNVFHAVVLTDAGIPSLFILTQFCDSAKRPIGDFSIFHEA